MNSHKRGYFEFQSSKGKIEGRIGTWSLNRFSEKNGNLNVSELFTLISTGMSIRAIADILLCAVEDGYRGGGFPYTIDDAFDWIDDIGGIGSATDLIANAISSGDDKGDSKKKAAKSR